MIELNINIIYTFVNIIILYLLLKKFLFKPVTTMIEKRTNDIKQSLEDADVKNKEAEKLLEKYENSVKMAEEESLKIIKDAKEKAKVEYDKIIADAKIDANKVIKEAERNVELQKQKAMEGVKDDVIEIAFSAATALMSENIDNEVNRKIIDDFLVQAGEHH